MELPGSELMPIICAALERGQHVSMQADGASMLPFIHSGDMIELEPLNGSPRKADIVLAKGSDGKFVVHRVVRVCGEECYLRGDAQDRRDGPIALKDLRGRVALSHHRGRVRRHGRGIWHFAGRIWALTGPLGLSVLRMALGLRRRVKGAPASARAVCGNADDRIKKTIEAWNNLSWDYDAFIAQTAPERMLAIDAPLLAQCMSGNRVLEIGCGTARLKKAVEARGGRYTGLDPSLKLIKQGTGRGERGLVRGVGEYLPFPDKSFDVILGGYCSFRYIQLDKLYPECRRVLRPGGIMAFTLWNNWALFFGSLAGNVRRGILRFPSFIDTTCNDVVRPAKEIRRLESAGFDVVEIVSTRQVPVLGRIPLVKNLFDWQGHWKGKLGALIGYDVIFICRSKAK